MKLELLTKELESLILKREQEGNNNEKLTLDIENLQKEINAIKYEIEFGL